MMNKFYRTILTAVFVLLGGGLLLVGPASAQSQQLQVDFGSDPLFPNVDNFAPGDSVSNTMTATNLTGETKQLGIELLDNVGCDQNCLSEQLNFSIKRGQNILLNGSLASLYDSGEVLLEELGAGVGEDYEIEVSFDKGAGDVYQDISAGFDLRVGVFGEETVSEEVSSGGGETSSGDGESSFLSAQSLSISDIKVSLISGTRAEITWRTNKDASSRVVYSPESSSHTLQPDDPPNYGYAYSSEESDVPVDENGVMFHSVNLDDLSPDTTYYYRCISHASPPSIARQGQFTTPGVSEDKRQEVRGDKEGIEEGQLEDDPQTEERQRVKGDKEIAQRSVDVEIPESASFQEEQGEQEVKADKVGEDDGQATTEEGSGQDTEETDEEATTTGAGGGLLVGSIKDLWWLWLLILAALLTWLFLVYKKRRKDQGETPPK